MFSNLAIFILSYLLIILSVVGFGFLSTVLFNRLSISNNLGYFGLIGLFFLAIYSYLSSIFIKHSYFHNSILLFIGLVGFYIYFKKNIKNFKSQIYKFTNCRQLGVTKPLVTEISTKRDQKSLNFLKL